MFRSIEKYVFDLIQSFVALKTKSKEKRKEKKCANIEHIVYNLYV